MEKPIQKNRNRQWTILEVLHWTTGHFSAKGVENPRASAEVLLSHVLGMERIHLYAQHDRPLMEEELQEYKTLILRRLSHEPVAYITGKKEFYSLDFCVGPEVLIPRPETEHLADAGLRFLENGENKKKVLEIGAGSGAVIITLAKEAPGHLFYASDCSFPALETAVRNAKQHRVNEHIHFFVSNWLDAVAPSADFDLILSNPPYIRTRAISGLAPDIVHHEPIAALDGGEDGMDAIRIIIREAASRLLPEGRLILEIGHDQAAQVLEAATAGNTYKKAWVEKDYSGHDRIAILIREQQFASQ